MAESTTHDDEKEGDDESPSVCSGCLNLIDDEDCIEAVEQTWHLDCFRCSACDLPLSNWYFEKDGLLFCRNDYWGKYGESCQGCSEVITGPVMVAGEHKFHPECFCCSSCMCFIGDGESYALVERSKLYCGSCYKRQMQPLKKNNAAPYAKKPHSIRLVEIAPKSKLCLEPATTFSLSAEPCCGGLQISKLFNTFQNMLLGVGSSALLATINFWRRNVHRIDEPNDIMYLHIGDKILEVNGKPVKDQPIEEIENLIKYSETVVQLTIEHDPDAASRRRSNLMFSQIYSPIPKEKESKERQYKKRDEGYMSSSSSSRHLRRTRGRAKERSSSLNRLSDGSHSGSRESCDLSRTQSFRVEPGSQRFFRPCDLVQGELLGKGFFGQVFKVTHRDTGEVMVLKELHRVDEDAQKNFQKEVAVLRSLHHNNVLKFIGVLGRDKKLHLITEYIGGGTLIGLINDENEPLPWEQRLNFAKDIASGMSYLHASNIIHRDLTSYNCLVREDKTVVVADFGLAKKISYGSGHSWLRGDRRERTRKKRHTVVGNPYWMAPEMMKGLKYDESVDVFSYGILLCEIIGRVQADPDFLPRTPDFGLNQAQFLDNFCRNCPESFYRIAFLCCNLNADSRPPFEVMEVWFEGLVMHVSVGAPLPEDLKKHIWNYSGRGQNTPDATTPEVTNGSTCPQLIENDSSRKKLTVCPEPQIENTPL